MRTVYIDLETDSRCDLKAHGAARYAADPSTHITVAAYAVDDEDPVAIDATDRITFKTWLGACMDLANSGACLVAHNAVFDRQVLAAHGGRAASLASLDSQWICSMKMARWLNLPAGLGALASYMLGETKDTEGHALMVQTAEQSRRGEMALLSDDVKEKLIAYCAQDVRIMRDCVRVMLTILHGDERALFAREAKADHYINQRGVPVDEALITSVVRRASVLKLEADAAVKQVTQGAVSSAGKRAALVKFLMENDPSVAGFILKDNSVDEVCRIIAHSRRYDGYALEPAVRDAGATSVKKWAAAQGRVKDGRLFDAYVFAAQAHGRWGSFGVQLHNFPRPKSPINADGLPDYSMTDLSRGLRSMVRAPQDMRLVVSDFRQVEFRILCWLAGETGMLDLLREGHDPYRLMASRIWSIDEADVDAGQRQRAKSAVLGLGYGMGVDGFARYAGLNRADASTLHAGFHRSFPGLTALYRTLERSLKQLGRGDAFTSVLVPEPRITGWYAPQVPLGGKIARNCLFIGLPSGRILRFWEPKGGLVWCSGKPHKLWTGSFVELIVCGIARDLLAQALLALCKREGISPLTRLTPIAHTHDEVICEFDPAHLSDTEAIAIVEKAMQSPGTVYDALPLACESVCCQNWAAAKP